SSSAASSERPFDRIGSVMRIVPLVLAFAWLAPQPGAAPAADPPSLTVFAAADLTFAFRELAPRFEKATGARVTLVFGSTGNFAQNIRHTLQIVQTGAAEAGIVALSVADVPEIDWVRVDASAHAPLDQAAAVVRRSPRPELGLAFIQFVNGVEGRPIMKRFGFML